MDDRGAVDCFFEQQLIGPPEAMCILALTLALPLVLVLALALALALCIFL